MIDKKTLNDVGLKYLPEGWHRMIDIPHSKWMDTAMKKYNADWSISHVSAESFFENKHGRIVDFSPLFFLVVLVYRTFLQFLDSSNARSARKESC